MILSPGSVIADVVITVSSDAGGDQAVLNTVAELVQASSSSISTSVVAAVATIPGLPTTGPVTVSHSESTTMTTTTVTTSTSTTNTSTTTTTMTNTSTTTTTTTTWPGCFGHDHVDGGSALPAPYCAGVARNLVENDTECTWRCERGYTPSRYTSLCRRHGLHPEGVSCADNCPAQTRLMSKRPGLGRSLPDWTHWCDSVRCGPVLVLHGQGLEWVAQNLLSRVSCARIRELDWALPQFVAKADVLVVSAVDFDARSKTILQDGGFTGAVLLVDEGCNQQDPTRLPAEELTLETVNASLEELRWRVMAAGLAAPPGSSDEEVLDLLRRAGAYEMLDDTPGPLPALRCSEKRTARALAPRLLSQVLCRDLLPVTNIRKPIHQSSNDKHTHVTIVIHNKYSPCDCKASHVFVLRNVSCETFEQPSRCGTMQCLPVAGSTVIDLLV